jgi:uncharacterized protein (UPF0335 family)
MVGGRVTNELMFELLKSIQKDVADLRFEIRTHGEDLRAVKGHMGSMMHSIATLVQSDVTRGTDFDHLRARVERIERRLDLNEGNA